MEERSLGRPPGIYAALERLDDDGLMTLAAFLLAAGIWHSQEAIANDVLPPEDLDVLGLKEPRARLETGAAEPFAPYDDPFVALHGQAEDDSLDPTEFYRQLAELIGAALESGQRIDTARAVAKGIASPDSLLRICALTSAVELFAFPLADILLRLSWFYGANTSDTTMALVAILSARVASDAPPASPPPRARPMAGVTARVGMMLIHGTNFPLGPTGGNRPVWSVPHTGPLFNHVSSHRPDIYAQPDHFRWEGGYSDYAREVASQNLADWVSRRQLNGIDALTHSHGGNVLMAATQRGACFGKVRLLSCPVHWPHYHPAPNGISDIYSIRIRFDFVILADRASQRFPRGSVPEEILPIWFTSHSATTEPATWQRNNLDRFL